MGQKEKLEEKIQRTKGKKEGNSSKKEGKYPCLIISIMTTKKSLQQTGKNFKNFKG